MLTSPDAPQSTPTGVLRRDPVSKTDTLVEQYGAGERAAGLPPLVILNGMLGQNRHWRPCVERIAGSRRIILIQPSLLELRGGCCSVGGVVRIVSDILISVAGGPAIIAGNSLGGHVALRLAIGAPALVRGLVLIGSSGLFERTLEQNIERSPSRPWIEKKIFELFHDRRAVPDTMVDEAHAELSKRPSARALVRMGKSAKKDHLGEELHLVSQPTLLAWGRNDNVTPPEVAVEFASLIAGSRLEWIDRCGHAPHIEKPAELAAMLETFADSLGPAGGRAGSHARVPAEGERVQEVA